jgi:hypothetical protein
MFVLAAAVTSAASTSIRAEQLLERPSRCSIPEKARLDQCSSRAFVGLFSNSDEKY